ncbi:MAG: hypothetical protein WAN87_02930 [Thermoplasmata archaeon]
MALVLWRLPRFLVLEPLSTVRIGLRLDSPACEIDVDLEKPRTPKSFVLMLGDDEGHYVQRVRLSGRARVFFDPQSAGEYQLLLANPMEESVTLHLKARNVPDVPRVEIKKPPRAKAKARTSRSARRPNRTTRT